MISVSSSMGSTTGVVGGDRRGAVAPVQSGQAASAPSKIDAPSRRMRLGDGEKNPRIVSFKCPPQRCNVVTCRSPAPKNRRNLQASSIAPRFLRTNILTGIRQIAPYRPPLGPKGYVPAID